MMLELREAARCCRLEPLLFEYEPSESDPTRPEPMKMTLSDGTALTLIGKIDRVDVYRKDGDAYLRIVDYKTGPKTFSLSDVAKGKSLQMLIYLFTLWRSRRPDFLKAVGAERGAVLPAGAIYLNLSLTPARLERPSDTPPPLTARSGLFLHDEDVLHAMDPHTPKVLIPLECDKEGNLTDSEHLVTLSEMGELANEVERTVRGIAEGIRCGRADATPLTSEKRAPCDYCRFYPVCRNTGGGSSVDD
jgi:ATP-dependent helicase/nuclease subunit B